VRTEADPFERAVDELLAREFEESPRMAASLGVDGFEDRLDDLSAKAFERRRRQDVEWLERFDSFADGDLSSDQGIDRALVVAELGERVALADWTGWRRTPEAYLETGITEMFLRGLRPEDEMTEAAVALLRAIPALLDEARANLDPALADPTVITRSLAECRADIGFARQGAAALASSPDNRARLGEAGEVAARGYERLAEFLEELAGTCTGSFVFGEERYNHVLQRGQLLDTDVVELRRQGWDEYHRVAEEMARLSATLPAGSDDWPSAVRHLQSIHRRSVDDMRALYEETCLRARDFLAERDLVTSPSDERCEVVPAPPSVRASLAVACYVAPPQFKPSRVGFFFVPYPVRSDDAEEVAGLLESNADYAVATTAVHEAYPGHHWHLMTMQSARKIRRVFTSTFFVEGWALAAEGLMREAGFFTPEQELGQLEARLFRAARIVVDTSLHTGEMGVDEAVAFMRELALLPESTARAEVARYCSWPTQASSYLTGAMMIERARQHWIERGGTVKAFNDAMAASGAMPVPLAVRAVGQPPALS
jgi:uncharacterized protein (DUF885 family)